VAGRSGWRESSRASDVKAGLEVTKLKRAARRAFQIPTVAAAARRFAALRGHSLVLVYHRVSPREGSEPALVPTVGPDEFVRQIQVLGEIGRIVPLAELLEDGLGVGPPRFALTFDDDYLTHIEWVLPTLQRLNVPGTFFISGRTLHGVGAYWFESLERLIADRGLGEARALLRVPGPEPEDLALACENDPRLQRIVETEGAAPARHLGPEHIKALSRADMSIGFHTVEHAVLTRLPDADLRSALVRGRERLAQLTGRPLLLFSYPHGKADQRTAQRVREAGYVAAWTGRPGPMGPGDDRYLLRRWEPGPLAIDAFVASVSIKLNRKGRPR
jgi:peptidoglycan/xylan/chitin deacetylase (PgdA/CDA1 family)